MPARPGRVLEAIAEDMSAAGRGSRADVYVLSDFQRTEWLASDSGGASIFEPLRRGNGEEMRVVLVATGSAARDNFAVLGARLERPQTVAGLPAVVGATVVNHSGKPLEGAHVQVEVDGAPLPSVAVKPIAAGRSRTVSVEVTFPDEGYSELAVGLDAVDGLPGDNTRRLALAVKRALKVLLVNGQPATDPVRDEVYFLRNALAPAGPFSSGIRLETIDPGEIEAVALGSFDCVALCNVAEPGDGATAALQRYVRNGGGLVFFLGDQVGDPEEYNRVFYADGTGLLPLPLRELRQSTDAVSGPRARRSVAAAVGVGIVRTGDHPATAMFPAAGSLSEHVRFRAYYRCSEPQQGREAPALTLARFVDDVRTPALIERRFGRGRVLLFTSSVDLDWNNWARSVDGSYVVTMLELFQYTARRDEERKSFVAGETLELSLLPEEYEPSGLFRSPASTDEPAVEARLREPVTAVGEPVTLEGPLATQLGTYTAELVRRAGGVERRPLAVNLDRVEFDLAVASARELDTALGDVPHEYVQADDAFLRDDRRARRELWPAVLLALAAILMLEQTLAWWFGTPRHAGRARRHRLLSFLRSIVGTKREPGARRAGAR
jgi:hypothetical protein